MEKEEIKNNMKRRSYRSCISSAYREVKNNLLSITQGYWKLFAVVAVIQGLLSAWMSTLTAGAMYVGFDFKGFQLSICTVLQLATFIALYGSIFTLINGKGIWWNIKRFVKTLPTSILFVAIYLIIAAIAAYVYILSSKDPANIPIINLIVIACLILPILMIITIPLTFVYCKYMVEPKMKLRRNFFRSYINGFRSWGFMFITIFLSTLCIMLFTLVLCLPEYVLAIIQNIAAYSSAANGDPLGLPSYLPAINFIASTWGSMVRIYTVVFYTYVVYYMYQTIECKIKDKGL